MNGPIFIGGYAGSGTRVISEILNEIGFHIGTKKNLNVANDFLPIMKVALKGYIENGFAATEQIKKNFKDLIMSDVKNVKRNWAIKHGEFMMCIDLLIELFPNAKFILCVRNGIDNILNTHAVEEMMGEFYFTKEQQALSWIDKRCLFYKFQHEKFFNDLKNYEDKFIVIKLEDLVYDKKITLEKLISFADGKINNINDLKNIITTPESIGRRNKKVIHDIRYYNKWRKTHKKGKYKHDPKNNEEIRQKLEPYLSLFGY